MAYGFLKKAGILLASVSTAAVLWAGTYTNFVVEGNQRIEDSIVLGTAGLVNGRAVDDAELNEAVQRLYASGLFSEVRIEIRGNTVIIHVVENATISGVYFEGNSKVSDEELASVVQLGPRDGLDKQKIDEDVQAIKRLYASKSRYDVEVRPVLIESGPNTYKLVFEIDEGSVSEIERVTFSGNQGVDDRTLRRVISQREAGIFSGLFQTDNYSTERVGVDRAAIENYYHEHGYYNVSVEVSESDYDAQGRFYITYRIREGQKFDFGEIKLTSEITGVSSDTFKSLIETKKGEIYKRSKISDTIEAIELAAEEKGYAFLRVTPDIEANEKDGTLDIEYKLENAERVYVERIDIRGNDTTIDRVIRRELEIVEGDPMNQRKISEARRKIEATGHFSKVSVQVRDGRTPNQKIVDIEVEEAPTGSLGFSGNYSSEAGFGAGIQFSENNFLGRGQRVVANLNLSGIGGDQDEESDEESGLGSYAGQFSFTEPRMFDRDVSGGFDLYYRAGSNGAAGYQTTAYGFEPRLSFPLNDEARVSLGYFAYNTEVRDVSDGASTVITDAVGESFTSGVSAVFTMDNTDLEYAATRGWILRAGAKYAGIGGDNQWFQTAFKAKYFKPVYNNLMQFSVELEGGRIEALGDAPVPVYERFFLGGSNTLKGFELNRTGPKDGTSWLGGNSFVAARTQLDFPLPGVLDGLGLRGAIWAEAGSVWSLDGVAEGVDDSYSLRATRGASVLWNLGAQTLSFNVNDPFQYEDTDVTAPFSVSFARRF